MKLNEPERKKLARHTSWQCARHAKLYYSDLFQEENLVHSSQSLKFSFRSLWGISSWWRPVSQIFGWGELVRSQWLLVIQLILVGVSQLDLGGCQLFSQFWWGLVSQILVGVSYLVSFGCGQSVRSWWGYIFSQFWWGPVSQILLGVSYQLVMAGTSSFVLGGDKLIRSWTGS